MGRDIPLEIPSYDGKRSVRLGQGNDCVVLQVIDSAGRVTGGIVMTPGAAEDMARSLKKRAKYAREDR